MHLNNRGNANFPIKLIDLSLILARLFEDPERELNVVMSAEWKSSLPVFDFDTDMDPAPVARAFAKEIWSKEYFETLKLCVVLNCRENLIGYR